MKLIQEIAKLNENLLNEAYKIGKNYSKIMFGIVEQDNRRPKKNTDKTLTYDFTLHWRFVYKDKKEEPLIKDLRKIVVSECISSPEFNKTLKKHISNQGKLFISFGRSEDKYWDIEVLPEAKSLVYNPMARDYFCKTRFKLTFDLPQWIIDSFTKAKTSKAFFFKNYKLKYEFNLPNLIRDKTEGWKDFCVDTLDWCIFHKTKMKDYIRELTKIPVNSNKISFEISWNASSNEVKLIVVRGIVKWLKRFGIPPKYSKYILAGLTIYGIIKLINKKEDETLAQVVKRDFNKFIRG